MSFTLTLVHQEDSGLAAVSAEGDATATEFPSGSYIHFDNILGPQWDTRFVALDMERVNYIDSSAIGWLLSVHKSFRAAGGKIAIHSVQPQVRQILDMLKIDRVVPVSADLAGARAALEPHMVPAPSA